MFRTLELTVAPGCHITAHYHSTPGIPAPVSRSRAAVANPCHSFRPAQLSPAGPSRSPPQRHSHHWHHRREQLIFFCRGSFDWAAAQEKSLSTRRGQHALNRTAGPKRFTTNPPAKPPPLAPPPRQRPRRTASRDLARPGVATSSSASFTPHRKAPLLKADKARAGRTDRAVRRREKQRRCAARRLRLTATILLLEKVRSNFPPKK